MVREAVRRNSAVGASKLFAEASPSEVEVARAAQLIQASVSTTVGYNAAPANDVALQMGSLALVNGRYRQQVRVYQ